MPTPSLLHAIGTGFIVALLVGLFMYGLSMSEITMINNYTAILQYISDKIAASIRSLYSSTYLANSNQSSISLNIPVEISSEKGYNVYIGRGEVLASEFPRLRERGDYNPQAFYVIASTADKKVYSISLLFQPTDLVAPLRFAKGELIVERVTQGFDPAEGYVESGILWFCRSPVYVKERANTTLSNYLVKIEFDPSRLNCTYQETVYTPSRSDVRFADSDGVSTLKYWIDSWEPNYARVWVQIPSIQPLENKTIYMYWGNPYAAERSDPGIFLFYDSFTRYNSLQDLLSRSPLWNVRPLHSYSYNLLPNGLLNALLDIKNKGFVILYYNRFIMLDQYQGVLLEALGRPYNNASKDAEYLLGLVNVGDTAQVFNKTLRPVIVDPSLSLDNYTVIYGTWSISSMGNDTFLNATSLSYVPGKGYYAIAIRENPPLIRYPPGQEYYQILYKVRIDNTSVIKGVLISEDLDRTRGFYLGLQFDSSGNVLKLLYSKNSLPALTDFTVLNSTSVSNIVFPNWVIIYVSVKSPGVANSEYSFQVINPDNGSTILEYYGRGTLDVYQPEYVGPFAHSPSEILGSSELWFDDLISCRYNNNTNIYFDAKKFYIIGLSPGWEITIVDYKDVLVYDNETNTTRVEKQAVYAQSSTVDESGIAVFDLTTYPILGEMYPVEFLFYYNGELIDRIEYPSLVSGGMVLMFRPYLQQPLIIDGGLIFTTGQQGVEYHIKTQAITDTNLRAGYNITSIGYFNQKLYYFILNPNYYNTTPSTYNPYNFTYKLAANFTFFVGLMVYESTGQGSANLTGIYEWIRVRPFVDPEPLAKPSYLSESLSIPTPPQVKIVEYVDRIVFSSELLVDLFIIVIPDSHYALSMVVRGRRA